MSDEKIQNNQIEDEDNIIILNGEDGKENRFEFLDLIELDNERYVVLLPADEPDTEEPGEVVILKIEEDESDSDEESFISVDDEETLNKVFEIFKDKFKNEFDFID